MARTALAYSAGPELGQHFAWTAGSWAENDQRLSSIVVGGWSAPLCDTDLPRPFATPFVESISLRAVEYSHQAIRNPIEKGP